MDPRGFGDRLHASASAIRVHLKGRTFPTTLVVLGSGFKGFEARLNDQIALDARELPHFPTPKVEGHGVMIVVGDVAGHPVVVMTGRTHLYEGWDVHSVVYPIRVMARLGVARVLLTNAAGSVNPALPPGTVVSVRDHLNLTGVNCLVGVEARSLGETFVDMSACYDGVWRASIEKTGGVVPGVYAGLLGPTYETPAEAKMLRGLGADVVGMSTVQEAIAARHLGLKVAALSLVTNMAGGVGSPVGSVGHGEVLSVAAQHRALLHQLITRSIMVHS